MAPGDVNNAPIVIAALGGSLRTRSYNRRLLEAARTLAPQGMRIDIHDLAAIPPYNADVEAEGDPAPVAALKETVRDAEGIIIATPEYNRSVPGVLKNAIDWLSRPPLASVLRGKPIAIIGATSGEGGTERAQLHLREILNYPGALVLSGPRLCLSRAYEKFSPEGQLQEEHAKQLRAVLAVLFSAAARSAAVRIEEVSGTAPAARALLQEFEDEMADLYGRHARRSLRLPRGLHPPNGCFLVLSSHGRPLACGGLRSAGRDVAEIRRMYVRRRARGRGFGRQLLKALEQRARELGYQRIRLETGSLNGEAQHLYLSQGYRRMPVADNGPWFQAEKDLLPGRDTRTASDEALLAPGTASQVASSPPASTFIADAAGADSGQASWVLTRACD